MTRLVDALATLGRQADISPSGRWARLDRACCPVIVTETSRGETFFTWCDHPGGRTVERYHDPETAIRAGMRRAGQLCGAPAGDEPDR